MSSRPWDVRLRQVTWRPVPTSVDVRTRVRIMRVEVEEQPELAEKFRVADVPTLVLVKRKRVVDRIEGRASAPTIEAMLSRHLSAPAPA